jgi:hypothetical protein
MHVAPDGADPDGATLAIEGAASTLPILDAIVAIKVHLTADCLAQAAISRDRKRLIGIGRRDGAHGRGIVCTCIIVRGGEDYRYYVDPPEVNKALLAAVVNSAVPDLQRLAIRNMDLLTQAGAPLAEALRRLSGLQELVIAPSDVVWECNASHGMCALAPALHSCSALTNLTFEQTKLDASASTALLAAVGKLYRLRKLQLPQLSGGHQGTRQLASLSALTSLTCIDVQQAFGLGGRPNDERNMESSLLQVPPSATCSPWQLATHSMKLHL